MKEETGNLAGMAALLRPEALKGKAYARIPRAPLIANLSLRAPILLAFGTSIIIVFLLALFPVSVSHRTFGTIREASSEVVVRSPKAGQVQRIAKVGDRASISEPLALLAQPIQSESGVDQGIRTRQELERLGGERDVEARLLEERYVLSAQQIAERERSLRLRMTGTATAIESMKALSEEAQRLNERLLGVGVDHVTRIDALAIAEKAANTKTRKIELQIEYDRLHSEAAELNRSKRILEIDRLREEEEMRRRFKGLEAALLQKATDHVFSIPAPMSGEVTLVTKKIGDWVKGGDELLLIGISKDEPQRIRVPVPSRLANLVAEGQVAKIWANPQRRNESPQRGRVVRVTQRTHDGMPSTYSQSPSDSGTFVAEVELDERIALINKSINAARTGAEIEVEIIFDSQPLYEALLPRRFLLKQKESR